jgi:hypothetical protein
MGTHACAPHAATAAGSSPTLRTARALHAQGLNSLTSAHTPVTTMPAYDIIFVDARGTKKRGSGGMRPRGVTCICRVLLAQLQHQRQKQPAPHTDQKVTTDGCNVQLQKDFEMAKQSARRPRATCALLVLAQLAQRVATAGGEACLNPDADECASPTARASGAPPSHLADSGDRSGWVPGTNSQNVQILTFLVKILGR